MITGQAIDDLKDLTDLNITEPDIITELRDITLRIISDFTTLRKFREEFMYTNETISERYKSATMKLKLAEKGMSLNLQISSDKGSY